MADSGTEERKPRGRPALSPEDQRLIFTKLSALEKGSQAFRQMRRQLATLMDRTERAIDFVYTRFDAGKSAPVAQAPGTDAERQDPSEGSRGVNTFTDPEFGEFERLPEKIDAYGRVVTGYHFVVLGPEPGHQGHRVAQIVPLEFAFYKCADHGLITALRVADGPFLCHQCGQEIPFINPGRPSRLDFLWSRKELERNTRLGIANTEIENEKWGVK